ncbi:unnamed protein product [Caenorhabditis auriculariae]|uniref:Uncharacterized protein n=1 Tax=Caenorhabditis auriculariae TaxID=2777116 RepID=A0A8S1HVH1_9PELO|nr:unnamed protein product [Caenorhabditis auriculariae]
MMSTGKVENSGKKRRQQGFLDECRRSIKERRRRNRSIENWASVRANLIIDILQLDDFPPQARNRGLAAAKWVKSMMPDGSFFTDPF